MKAATYRLERAASLDDAVRMLQDDSDFAKVVAGGQSLGAMLNLRLAQPDRLVDMDGIAGLADARVVDGRLVLGAMTTHAAIEDGLGAEATRGFLPHVARGIAYRPVRNRGTVGGSLCHADPAADWVSAMAAADAQLTLRGAAGPRTVPAARFMRSAFECDLEIDEVLEDIRIAAFSPQARWSYRKFCRKTGEFALAIATAVRDPARGIERVVLGGLDGPPQVFDETGLLGRLADPAARDAFLARAVPGLDTLRTALLADLLGQVAIDIGVPA